MYILSQHYHFDRQWKELERPNASFEGRTTHPTAIERKMFAVHLKTKELMEEGFLTRSVIAKDPRTHIRLTTIRNKKKKLY